MSDTSHKRKLPWIVSFTHELQYLAVAWAVPQESWVIPPPASLGTAVQHHSARTTNEHKHGTIFHAFVNGW
ncbi:hypothetical protein VKT23_002804 [Stygiomarasmius scandens]|uniref:Uncharacterized protein n=1 Tax=Marasmiellus scandens TaxID=2682957 RepID=A0ABR1JYD0_9AGAR